MEDNRKLIYVNLANGCTREQVANAQCMTLEEVDATFAEVAMKLSAHLVFSCHPYTGCQTQADAMANRVTLIPMLETLNLDAGLIERVKSVRHNITRAV